MSLINKPIGLILLLVGLAIIFYSLYSSFNIFTGDSAPPEIFKVQTIAQGGTVQDLQAQLQKVIEEQLRGMLPADSLPALLNLISWSILAGILIFGGAQIAGLGVKLLK